MTDHIGAGGDVDGAGKDIDRVGAFLAGLERLAVDDLAVLALPEPDPDERAALIARAEAAGDEAGRLDEVRAAPGRAREALVQAFSFRGYDPTWFGLNWGRSLGRADDRARLVGAVEDAAVAAAVADILAEDDVAKLREPFERIASMAGTAPAANPQIERAGARRAVIAAILVLYAAGAAAVGGAIAALGAIAARRRRPPAEGD
jgi:hypothetical protein